MFQHSYYVLSHALQFPPWRGGVDTETETGGANFPSAIEPQDETPTECGEPKALNIVARVLACWSLLRE
jgi:hypothetical protein